MLLELNDVLLQNEPRTLSMMARSGEMVCLTGGSAEQRARWLHGIMGFVPVLSGYICIDGEPLTTDTVAEFRRQMAYAPSRLEREGQIRVFEPPSVQDVFSLKENRHLPISNGLLNKEMKLISEHPDECSQWLAVAVLRDKPILLVDDPTAESVDYLRQQAAKGRVVIVTSSNPLYRSAADKVIEIEDER